jgi:hypothetical protein
MAAHASSVDEIANLLVQLQKNQQLDTLADDATKSYHVIYKLVCKRKACVCAKYTRLILHFSTRRSAASVTGSEPQVSLAHWYFLYLGILELHFFLVQYHFYPLICRSGDLIADLTDRVLWNLHL